MKKKLLLFAFLLSVIFLQAQTYQWAFRAGASNADQGNNIAVDGSGNVFVCGSFTSTVDFDPGAGTTNLASAGSTDIFFAKYDATGALVWAKRIGGTGADLCSHIAIDGSANIYITGTYTNTVDFDPNAGTTNLTNAGGLDGYFAKYTTTGTIVWAKKVGGGGNDFVTSIIPDAAGVVYITGYYAGTCDFDPGAGTQNLTSLSASNDIFVGKYDASGNYTWAFSVGSTLNDYGRDITIDGSGNCYISGSFAGSTDFDPGAGTATLTSVNDDIYLAKYTTAGAYVFADRMGSTSSDGATFVGVDLDGSGNIYMTGHFQGLCDFDPSAGSATLTSGGSHDVFIAKYTNAGAYTWAKRIGGTGTEYSYDIRVESSGDLFIIGQFANTVDFDPGAGTQNQTSNGNSDIFFAKYDSSGGYLWANKIGSTQPDIGLGVTSDATSVYITGSFQSTADFNPGSGTANLTASGGNTDVFVGKYVSDACTVTMTSSTNNPCNGQCIGTATATSSGTGPFTYSWTTVPVQTTQTATGLCAGTYSCTVTDATTCSATQSVTITAPSAIAITLTPSGAVSACLCNGSVTSSVSGGISPYTYSWSTGATTTSIVNVCGGTYTLTVTDANGCTRTQTATVTQPAPISVTGSATPSTICNGNCSSITTATSGGSPGYTYSWSPATGLSNPAIANPSACPTATTSYTLTVTDIFSCTGTFSVSITVNPTPTVTVTPSPASVCIGSSSPLTASGAATYTWSPATGLSATTGASVTTSTTANVTYTVTGTSAAGCTDTQTVTVTANPPPQQL